MQLPKKSTKLRKLIDAMPKNKNISKMHLVSIMQAVGYDSENADRTLSYLQGQGYLKRAGSHYGLSAGVMKNFLPKIQDIVEQAVFKPLSDSCIASMRRAQRLEDGREPMHFLPVATRPMMLEG